VIFLNHDTVFQFSHHTRAPLACGVITVRFPASGSISKKNHDETHQSDSSSHTHAFWMTLAMALGCHRHCCLPPLLLLLCG